MIDAHRKCAVAAMVWCCTASFTFAQCPGEGSCCKPNGSPGCENISCCKLICSQDPFCCDVEWDQLCVDQAIEANPCGDLFCDPPLPCPGEGFCCEANGSPGCDDEACCSSVCETDPFCCETEWDAICAEAALKSCPDVCVGVGACCFPDGSCTELSQNDCNSSGGVFHGINTACGDVACPLPVDCGAGIVDEGEACGEEIDLVNGGCNSTPNIFTELNDCNCAIAGNAWAEGGTRDTDWYQVTPDEDVTIIATLDAPFEPLFATIAGLCDAPVIDQDGSATGELVIDALAGETVTVFVATAGFDGVPCDSGMNDYTLSLTCEAASEPGACCLPDGSCMDVPIEDCPIFDIGVTFFMGMQCSDVECPQFPVTRAQAVDALLDPGSGVEVDLAQAGVWSPFELYIDEFGAGFEGLLPADSLLDPGDALIDPDAKPGLSVGPNPSYIFWINDGGPAGFAHPTRFALVDAMHPDPVLGDGIIVEPYEWWPLITLPGGEPEHYFDCILDRVTEAPASPDNPDGLVAGSAASSKDLAQVEPSTNEPAPNDLWAIVVRSSNEERHKEDFKRYVNDLKDHYEVPEDNIVTAGDPSGNGATKQDFEDAIDELCMEIEKSGQGCDKIFVRIVGHGEPGKISFTDGKFTKAEFGALMKKLAMKGTPICLQIDVCSSGSLLDPHNWDFPAGSSVTTSADGTSSSWSDTWEDDEGNPITGSLYLMAFSQCLNSDPDATPSADQNDDGFIDECEAHEWVVAQNPSWEWPGNGMDYNGTRANPQKRVVGLSAGGLNVLVRNGTDDPKTDFHITFKGEVTGGTQHAWRSNENDQLLERWAQDGESVEYDEEEDETTVSWEDTDDPVQPGEFIHFFYAHSGLKPIHQVWTPTAGGDGPGGGGADADLVPAAESSTFLTSDEMQRVIRTISRSAGAGGADASIDVEYYYRVLDEPVSGEDLNLPTLDGLAPAQFLGTFVLPPDTPQEFLVDVPADIAPDEVLVIESHLSWSLNGNTALQFLQFAETELEGPPVCEGDLDGDNITGSSDLNLVLGDFGCTGGGCDGDADGDGDTDSVDLNQILGNFGCGA